MNNMFSFPQSYSLCQRCDRKKVSYGWCEHCGYTEEQKEDDSMKIGNGKTERTIERKKLKGLPDILEMLYEADLSGDQWNICIPYLIGFQDNDSEERILAKLESAWAEKSKVIEKRFAALESKPTHHPSLDEPITNEYISPLEIIKEELKKGNFIDVPWKPIAEKIAKCFQGLSGSSYIPRYVIKNKDGHHIKSISLKKGSFGAKKERIGRK